MTSGKIHATLASHAGEWKTKTSFGMTPDTEPKESEGTAVNEMIMGGRYLKSKHFGTAWGMPIEGTSIWIDNIGAGT